MDIIRAEAISDYTGDDFSLKISKVTLERIESVEFSSLEAFFSTSDLSMIGGPYTGGQIFKAVRRVLHQNFKDGARATRRRSEIAAVQAQIAEIKKEQEAVLAPLHTQLENLMRGTVEPSQPTPIKAPEA